MKKNTLRKREIVFIIFSLIVTLLGANVGHKIYGSITEEVIVMGILGTTNLIFMYFLFMSPRSPYATREKELNIEFPRDFKFVILFFLLSILVYLSITYMYNAIIFVINTIQR